MTIIASVDRFKHAQTVAMEAEALADAFDVPLHLVHVLRQSEFIELERTSIDETGSITDMSEIREISEKFAEEAAVSITREYEVVGLVGDPKKRIIEYADEHNTQYIVVGTRKRSPTGKAVFGSVAQSIILNTSCPVVTIVQK